MVMIFDMIVVVFNYVASLSRSVVSSGAAVVGVGAVSVYASVVPSLLNLLFSAVAGGVPTDVILIRSKEPVA